VEVLITSNSLATAAPERLPIDSTAAASVAVRFWRSPWIKVVSCPQATSLNCVRVGARQEDDIHMLLGVNRKASRQALLPAEKQRHVELAVGHQAHRQQLSAIVCATAPSVPGIRAAGETRALDGVRPHQTQYLLFELVVESSPGAKWEHLTGTSSWRTIRVPGSC